MPYDQEYALVSVEDVLLDLGLTDTDYNQIERLVNSASRRILGFCDRPALKARDVVLQFNGDGGPLLDVGAPIIRVQTVTILSQRAGAPDTDLAIADLIVDSSWGTIFYRGGFAPGVQNVQFVGRIGMDPVPPDLREACLALIRFWRTTGLGASDLQSERIGDYSYTRFAPVAGDAARDLPAEVQTMIEPYKRWSF